MHSLIPVYHLLLLHLIKVNVVNAYEDDVQQGIGADWVKCAHSRWLHEECINSVDYNSCGLEIFCSHCLVKLFGKVIFCLF